MSLKKNIINIITILKNVFRYSMFNYKGTKTVSELKKYLYDFNSQVTVISQYSNKKYIFVNKYKTEFERLFHDKNYYKLAIESNKLYHKLSEMINMPVKEHDYILQKQDKISNRVDVNYKLYLILDNIRSPYNVGAFFRICDAVSAEKIFLCGITPTPENNKKLHRTAVNTVNYIKWEYYKYIEDAYKKIKKDCVFFCVDTGVNSINYNNINYCSYLNSVFVFGNEEFGINPAVLEKSDYIINLPMFGTKNSLNVSVSAGVVLYNYINNFV